VSDHVVGVDLVGNWILSDVQGAALFVVTVNVVVFFKFVLFLFWRTSGRAGLTLRPTIEQLPGGAVVDVVDEVVDEPGTVVVVVVAVVVVVVVGSPVGSPRIAIVAVPLIVRGPRLAITGVRPV
jgi:hypothetical protein